MKRPLSPSSRDDVAAGTHFVCRIESLAAGGDGVAHLPDGRTVFVEQVAPGDLARVELTSVQRRHARARLVALLEPGPDRVAPRCAVFGECGGCTWQHLSYTAQVRAKAAILRSAIERIGRLACPDPLPFHPSPSPYAYRLRARLLLEDGRVGYRRRRSHSVCDTRACPILVPELEAAIPSLAHEAARGGRGEREIACGSDGGALIRRPGGGPGAGPPLELAVEGRMLRVSPGVFAQANRGLLEPLAASVRRALAAGALPDGLLVELHAGAGFFTLGCAPGFLHAIAVESSAAACEDLRFNLERAGLHHVEVREDGADTALAELARAAVHPDVVLMDPPRAGLGRDAAEQLARLEPHRIVYLSCDPATLSRDLAVLVEGGYRLESLEGFDLFPQTPHVEALAVLERSGRMGIRA